MDTSGHNHQVYQFAGFTLDLGAGTLRAGDAQVPLRPKSFEVLKYLVEHAGLLATKEEMLQAIWGHHHVSDGSLAQCIIDIRKALGDASQTLVQNVPRRGYILHAEATMQAPAGEQHALAGHASVSSGQTTPAPPGRTRRLIPGMIIMAVLLVAVAGVGLFFAARHLSRPHLPVEAVRVPENSIAVLPFLDLSANADQDWFAEGLSEEILNSLSQYPGLRVIARTSSFSFKNSGLDIPAIGNRLGVAFVLEGSVRKFRQTVRITVQLVRASDGVHLWSQTYDRQLENVLQLQSEIASSVANALEITLVEKGPAARIEPGAYEAFLQAEYFYNRRNPGDLQKAEKFYRSAIAIAPGFARAWVGLSGLDNLLVVTGLDNRQTVLDEQLAAARKGVELDADSAVAHLRLAQAYYANGQPDKADMQWDEAARLNSNDPMVFAALAGAALNELQFDRSVRLQRRAVAADPISPLQRENMANYLFLAGRFEDALSEYRQTMDLNPRNRKLNQQSMAQTLVMLGRYREALDLSDAISDRLWRDQIRAMALRKLGQTDDADAALQDMQSVNTPEALALLTQYFAWSGDLDRAFGLLEKCISRCWKSKMQVFGLPWTSEVVLSPLLASLRKDPRWRISYQRYRTLAAEYYGGESTANSGDVQKVDSKG